MSDAVQPTRVIVRRPDGTEIEPMFVDDGDGSILFGETVILRLGDSLVIERTETIT